MTCTRRVGLFHLVCFIILAVTCVKTLALAQEPSNSKINLGTALKEFSELNDKDKTEFLEYSGLPQINKFSPAKVIAYIIFGIIGFVAFMYGKKSALFRPAIIGLALMLYPYFFKGVLAIYLVGIALTLALYFWRE